MKILTSIILTGLTNFAIASSPPIPQNGVVNPEFQQEFQDKQKIISNQESFVIKSFNEKNIPQDLNKWIPWVNKDTYDKDCIDSFCVFIPNLTIVKGSTYKFILDGTAMSDITWVPLPSSNKIWPLTVMVNGQKAVIVKHNEKPFVQVPKKDFRIEIDYNSNVFDKNSTFELPFNIVSFDNKTTQSISLRDKILSLNDIVKQEEQNSFQEIKVFRKFTDAIPYYLETKIQINFSGKTKDLDLGDVLPQDFKLSQINSDLKVTYKNNHYYVTVVSGTHFINFKSFLNKDVLSINVKGLVNESENEIWSIQKNNNIRNIDVIDVVPIDPKQVSVPQEWLMLPSYLVKDKIDIKVAQQGLSLNTDLKVNANRSSIFGFNDNIYSKDEVRLLNQNTKELRFNLDVNLQSITLSQPKMIFKDGNNPYILLSANDNNGSVFFDNKKGEDIPSQLADSYYVDNWNIYLTPRSELIWAKNAKVESYSFWFNSWNLYSLFSLSILIIALYKMVGKEAAFFALFSLISFYENNAIFWIFWLVLVIAYAFNRFLPEKYVNLKKNVNSISLFTTILVIIFTCEFVFNEIFSIMHPNVSHKLNFSPISYVYSMIFIGFIFKLVNYFNRDKTVKRKKSSIIFWLFTMIVGFVFISVLLTNSKIYSGRGTAIMSTPMYELTKENDIPAPAPASMPIMPSAKMNSNRIDVQSMDSASIEGLLKDNARKEEAKEKSVKRNITQEKVQIGHDIANIPVLHNYNLKPDNKEAVKFYIADKWLVNIYGILQSIFLVGLSYILIIYNLLLFNKVFIIEKLPKFLANNMLTKRIKLKIIEV